MMTDEVKAWMEGLGLSEHLQVFVDNEIDLEAACDLNEQDLRELGLAMGPRKKLLRAIAALNDSQTDSKQITVAESKPAHQPEIIKLGERRQVTVLFADICGYTKLTGEMMRDGYENLNVDEKRLEELGMKDFTYAVKITCENHESSGKVAVQQWDAKAKKWSIVSKFYDPLRDITGPLVEEDSAAFAKENNITPRDCK